MKRVKITKPKTMDGGPFLLPVVGSNGQPVLVCMKCDQELEGDVCAKCAMPAEAKTVEGDIKDILKMLVRFYPRDALCMDSIIHANKLNDACDQAGEWIELEPKTYEWVQEQLKNDKIGVQMFAMNLLKVLDAMDVLVSPEDAK